MKKPSRASIAFAAIAIALAPASALRADIRMPSVFSNHMVLQQSPNTPVWGWANPGEKITVALPPQTASTTAGADGKWRVSLDLSQAQPGPHALTIQGANRITISDVLIGEVWLASGQSNMVFRLSKTIGAKKTIAQSANPQIREFSVDENPARHPQDDCPGRWTVASPETTPLYSGVAYFFAKKLNAELGRPVGILNSSSGGTMAEAWTSLSALSTDPDLKQGAENNLREYDELPARQAAYADALSKWLARTNRADRSAQDAAGFAASKWQNVTLKLRAPVWRQTGAVWLRKEIELPDDRLNKPMPLNIEALTGFEKVYWNGHLVGETTLQKYPGKNAPRFYEVPVELLSKGKNQLCIRVYTPLQPLVFTGKADRFRAGNVNLAGAWQLAEEYVLPKLQNSPEIAKLSEPFYRVESKSRAAALFNGMIHPLIPYGIAGIIWYQGESGAKKAWQYRTSFPLLINDWRARWAAEGRPGLPFYFCQLPAYRPFPGQAPAGSWSELREAQTLAAAQPGNAQAVLIDLGEETDIHPRNKTDPGERLARLALAKTYGKNIAFSGPVFESLAIEGATVRVNFKHADGGLVAQPIPATYQPTSSSDETKPVRRNSPKSELEGFALCGADGEWHWADARIQGGAVIVASPRVPKPAHIRYAWSDFPTCNLFNGAGLPAAPFRTDDFPAITKDSKYGLTDAEGESR